MVIALDYDGTYTLDPECWELFINIMTMAGHKIICVTGRSGIMDEVELRNKDIEVIYTGDQYKAQYCLDQGIKIDVWIDDMPNMIMPAGKLVW